MCVFVCVSLALANSQKLFGVLITNKNLHNKLSRADSFENCIHLSKFKVVILYMTFPSWNWNKSPAQKKINKRVAQGAWVKKTNMLVTQQKSSGVLKFPGTKNWKHPEIFLRFGQKRFCNSLRFQSSFFLLLGGLFHFNRKKLYNKL